MLPLYIAEFAFPIRNEIFILVILTIRLNQIVLLSALNDETPKTREEREENAINSSNKILIAHHLGQHKSQA